MLLEFGVKNFRSIKDEAVFSLIANDNESKSANVFTLNLATGEEIRLLKSAAIFGANASGKTALLQALFTFIEIIYYNNFRVGDEIGYYNPFKFNPEKKNQPVTFWMSFIGPNNYRYVYSYSFNLYNIIEENLEYYQNSISENPTLILSRNSNVLNRDTIAIEDTIHTGKLSESFGGMESSVFHNQLFLSKFGKDNPHRFITPIFSFFNKFSVLNALNLDMLSFVEKHITKKIKNDATFKNRLENLIKIADTKLSGITINSFLLNDLTRKNGKVKLEHKKEDRIEILHKVFKDENEVGEDTLDLYNESAGTLRYVIIGGMILDYIERGGILFIDEIDASLHPMLVKTLLEIIQSKKLNPKNAQVVFTTHDINVLNQNLFRRDQYWFTEKNKFGETELYSLQDFEKVNEYTPFNSWYMAGKFGAIPKVQSIEKILDEENEEG